MKVYKVRWTPEVKRAAIMFLVAIFAAGLLVGLFIGKLVFQVEATKVEPTEPLVTEETFESTPAIETTCPTTAPEEPPEETTVPPTEETEPPVLYYDCPLPHELQDYIRELCEAENVPMGLVIALIDKESTFKATAISATDDYGLMQINIVNHGWLSEKYGVTDFLDPYQNVYCGIMILNEHLDNYDGNLSMALMAYNMGAGGARKLWNQGVYSTSYTTYILDAMSIYDSSLIAA